MIFEKRNKRNVVLIVGKNVKNSTDRKLMRRNSTKAKIQNLPQNSVKCHKKRMFDHPLSLQGVYSSIFYANFHSKMQKRHLHVQWQRSSTASLKNSTNMSALSARFSNYDSFGNMESG